MTDQMANDVLRVYPDLKKAVLRRQVYARFSTLNQSLKGKNVKGVQQNLVKYIKNNRQSVFKDKKIPRRDKIAYALLSLGLPCYKFGWKMYEKIKGGRLLFAKGTSASLASARVFVSRQGVQQASIPFE